MTKEMENLSEFAFESIRTSVGLLLSSGGRSSFLLANAIHFALEQAVKAVRYIHCTIQMLARIPTTVDSSPPASVQRPFFTFAAIK